MPAEHEAAEETRPLRRLSQGAPAQQREQHDARKQNVCDYAPPTMDVTSRSDYVHCERDDQQTGRTDMRGLKVPVAWPQPPADCRARWHGQKEQREQRQDAGVFVTRRGQLEMLNGPVIGAEQQPNVENRGAERQPAEQLVHAHREGTGGASPRPNGQHAEQEASSDRAEPHGLRNLPQCSQRHHER